MDASHACGHDRFFIIYVLEILNTVESGIDFDMHSITYFLTFIFSRPTKKHRYRNGFGGMRDKFESFLPPKNDEIIKKS